MNFVAGAILAVGFLLAPPAAAQGPAFAACIEEAAARDLAGKEAFQTGVHDLAVQGKPEFEELARLNMRLQISLARSRRAKFTYLLKHDPARIETGSLSKFRNFDWAEADDAAFARENADNRELLASIADLRRKNDGNPDWPALRDYFGTTLSPQPAFRALMAALTENDRAVKAGLKDCRREEG